MAVPSTVNVARAVDESFAATTEACLVLVTGALNFAAGLGIKLPTGAVLVVVEAVGAFAVKAVPNVFLIVLLSGLFQRA